MPHLLRTIGSGLIAVLIACSVAQARSPQPKSKLDLVARFQTSSLQLDVATYRDPEIETSENKVALLGISNSPLRNSISFHRREWEMLIDLWTKAVQAQSSEWKVIGSLTEVATADPSRITVIAGNGIRLTIVSSREAAVSFNLSRADMTRFQGALVRVREFLSN